MAELNENPCSGGLTPACFETFPEWAKRALFLRLLYLLLPSEITSKLPGILRLPFFFPGPFFPPDWKQGDPPPEGAFIPPDTIFPPDWLFGDPWPEGVFIWIAFSPPDGLDYQDGIIVSPGTIFPDDWKPGDPLPAGAFISPILPEDIQQIGPLTFFYLTPGSPGYPGASVGGRGRAEAYNFFDNFTTLDTDEWSTTISVEGTIDIVDSQLRMQKAIDGGFVSITRADSSALLSMFTLSFKLRFISGTSSLRIDYWTGKYYLYIRFELPDILKIYDGSDWQLVTLSDFTNIEYSWRFSINYRGCFVYQDDFRVATALTLESDTTPSGTHRFVLEDTGNIRIDNFHLTGI
jgi:hypothetical protein